MDLNQLGEKIAESEAKARALLETLRSIPRDDDESFVAAFEELRRTERFRRALEVHEIVLKRNP